MDKHIKNCHGQTSGGVELASTSRIVGIGRETTTSMNDSRLEYTRSQENFGMYANLGVSALTVELEQREAERKELASVQAHVEAEIERLKMALDILQKSE